MFERDWQMRCGKATCLHLIGDVDRLPDSLRDRYRHINMVQAYAIQAMTAAAQDTLYKK